MDAFAVFVVLRTTSRGHRCFGTCLFCEFEFMNSRPLPCFAQMPEDGIYRRFVSIFELKMTVSTAAENVLAKTPAKSLPVHA